MKDYRITVQPTPGAIVTVKGYANGQFLGYYGADIAFYELANNINRFKGFKAQMKRQPVQSFWTFTVEVGVAVHSRDKDKIKSWSDLSGKRVFTGPLPWDVRAHLERALATLGVKHEYQEVDLATTGSLLDSGAHLRPDHLLQRGDHHGAVDHRGFARRGLGGAQPERGGNRQAQEGRFRRNRSEAQRLQA